MSINVSMTSPSGVTLATIGKYCEDNVNVTPVLQEKSVSPSTSAQSIVADSGKVGLSQVNVAAIQTEEKSVTPTAAVQAVTPTSGKYLSKVTVNATPTETKSVSPTTAAQDVTPSSGKFLSKVTVGAIQTEEKSVTPSNAQQVITPTSGKYLSKVTVAAAPADETMKKWDVTVAADSGSSVVFNMITGDTWLKAHYADDGLNIAVFPKFNVPNNSNGIYSATATNRILSAYTSNIFGILSIAYPTSLNARFQTFALKNGQSAWRNFFVTSAGNFGLMSYTDCKIMAGAYTVMAWLA